MNILCDTDVELWCNAIGISLVSWRTLSFSNPSGGGGALEFMIPKTASEMIGLSIVSTRSDDELSCATPSLPLLWLRDWDIWSNEFEAIGRKIIEDLRHAPEAERPLLGASGHLFEQSEVVNLQAFLLQVLIFEWDAYLVAGDGHSILQVSHDGWIRVFGRTQDVTTVLLDRYKPWRPKMIAVT